MKTFTKKVRIVCVLLAIVLAVVFTIVLVKSYHPSISGTILVCGIIHGFFTYVNAYSSKLEFAHLISTFFALICVAPIALVLGASMKYGYWALALGMLPTVLALISPILYSTNLKVETWRYYVIIGLTIINSLCFNTENDFHGYISVQVIVVMIAVMYLPEKEEKQNT